MTHADPAQVFARLITDMSERKARLLRVALARAIWNDFTHPALRDAIAVAERYADGGCGDDEAAACSDRVYDLLVSSSYPWPDWLPPLPDVCLAINSLASAPLLLGTTRVTHPPGSRGLGGSNWQSAVEHRPAAALAAMRDLFGDPQPHLGFDPRWRTETVTLLATGIYRERAFDRMPILADALEEAGCDRLGVLDHCRGEAEHFRGCWVVDSVLGKG